MVLPVGSASGLEALAGTFTPVIISGLESLYSLIVAGTIGKVVYDNGTTATLSGTTTSENNYAPNILKNLNPPAPTGEFSADYYGVLSSITLEDAAASILSSLGLSIESFLDEKAPGFVEGLYNTIINTGKIYQGTVLTALFGSSTFIDSSLINSVKDYLIENNAYVQGDAVFPLYPVGELPEFDIPEITSPDLLTFLAIYGFSNLPYFVTHPEQKPEYAGLLTKISDLIDNCPTGYRIVKFDASAASSVCYVTAVYSNIDITTVTNATVTSLGPNVSSHYITQEAYDKYPKYDNITFNASPHNEINRSWAYNFVNGVWSDTPTTHGDNLFNTIGVYFRSSGRGGVIYHMINMGIAELINGLHLQSGAVIPTLSDDISVTYPGWAANAVDMPVYNDEDAPIGVAPWFPIALPNTDVIANGLSVPQAITQAGELVGTIAQDTFLDAIPGIVEGLIAGGLNIPLDPPVADLGTVPALPPVTSGSAIGLINIYNPTQGQLSAFSGYLWSTDFIDQIIKLFNDPMSAIIGLHILYATPHTSGQGEIKVGYLGSGVNAGIVSNQYVTVDCGSVTINEYFNDATDYAPYTKIHMYLPFIGIVELNTDDVMNATVSVSYKVDIMTGTCLATIRVNKGGFSGILYQYNGNCAVQLPLTGGNYASIFSSLLSAGIGIASTVATGGATAPFAIANTALSVANSKASIAMSGSLGANAGAMGNRKPYIIITRQTPYSAANYNSFYGFPINKNVKLSNLTGYTKIKSVHVSGIVATDEELAEIEMKLKEGVIL